MSFDIRIQAGDINFDSQGRLNLVRGQTKLFQDILKLINTTLGSDSYSPQYGVSLTEASVGIAINSSVRASIFQSEIQTGLIRLQQEQNILARTRRLTDDERIRQVDSVIVEQDSIDPRQFNIMIELTLYSSEQIQIPTNIRI